MNVEQQKYQDLWKNHPQYRIVAPGAILADHFLSLAKPLFSQTVIDFGCGTGRGGLSIFKKSGCRTILTDFVDGCLDLDVQRAVDGDALVFRQHDLTQPWPHLVADFGYCTDVMEHIPTADVDRVLSNIVQAARKVYFCISTVDDVMGELIGEPLHLTVKPSEWWKERFEALKCRVIWEQTTSNACVFYVTAYATFNEIEHKVELNIEEQRVVENIRSNLGLGLKEASPHEQQDVEIMLLCGGPSLNDFTDEIVAKNKAGMPAVTVNGTYNWLLDHGGKPGAQVLVDAREFNKRFTAPIIDDCKYLVSSQCSHELVRSLPKDQTYLWHGAGDLVKDALEAYDQERGQGREWYPIPGGTTVTLRALPLLAMLGFRKIHVYGFDSCMRGNRHHAYEQPENDAMQIAPIYVNGKEFHCQGWMIKQANEFQDIVRHILTPAGVELSIYGDGLIANIIEAAANASKEQ